MPICLRLLVHFVREAASRTFCTAGNSSPMRIEMIAITTNNSIRVKPRRRVAFMASVPGISVSIVAGQANLPDARIWTDSRTPQEMKIDRNLCRECGEWPGKAVRRRLPGMPVLRRVRMGGPWKNSPKSMAAP